MVPICFGVRKRGREREGGETKREDALGTFILMLESGLMLLNSEIEKNYRKSGKFDFLEAWFKIL